MTDVKELVDAIRVQTRNMRNKGEPLTLDVVENLLLHLETSDDAFHRYVLVRNTRSQIAMLCAEFMDADFERMSLAEGEHEAVYRLVQRILASPQYQELKKRIIDGAQTSVNSAPILEETDTSIGEDDFLDSLMDGSDDGTELDDLGESYYGLLPPGHELRRMVKNLGAQHPVEVRLDALRALSHLSPSDLVASEHWGQLKSHLRTALLDGSEIVFREALQLHLKMFASGTVAVVREIFLHYAGHLQSAVAAGMFPAGPCNASSKDTQPLLTQVAVFNSLALSLPRSWLRFGERSLLEVVDAGMAVVLQGGGAIARYVALVDPRATWFSKWMNGNISRRCVFEHLGKNPAALQTLCDAMTSIHSTVASPYRTRRSPSLACCHLAGSEGFVYSKAQGDYLFATHATCMVGELLLYASGRALVEASGIPALAVNSVLTGFAELLCRDARPVFQEDKAYFQPGALAADLLKRVVSHALPSQVQLVSDECLDVLLEPIRQCAACQPLDPAHFPLPKDVLLEIADILGLMAMSESGRRVLLQGTTEAAAAAANLVIRALDVITHKGAASEDLLLLIQAYLFVCRQLYNTHEGLQVLSGLNLHTHIAAALKNASMYEGLDELLTDNLLNFAWTPLGVELLGALPGELLHQCVARMFHRFRDKVQVSKYEKFGYGVMVAELATSFVGMTALQATGFVDFVTTSLMKIVEEHVDYMAPGATNTTKPFRKALMYASTVTSSFAAVASLCHTPRTSTAAFLASLASDVGKFGCFNDNFDYARLRLIMLLAAALDNMLVLDVECRLTERLLAWQRACVVVLDGGPVQIVDACSLLRNRILVAALVVGGPNERRLPAVTIDDDIPPPALFAQLPVPDSYLVAPVESGPSPPSIDVTSEPDLRQALLAALRTKPTHSIAYRAAWGKALRSILVRSAQTRGTGPLPAIAVVTACDSQSASPTSASDIDRAGVALAEGYGVSLGILDSTDPTFSRWVLRMLVSCREGQGARVGFDWFATTVAMLCNDPDATAAVLTHFSTQIASHAAWHNRDAHALPYRISAHWIGRIVTAELPLVAGALRLSGMTASGACLPWMRQCFWNVLDWPEICSYIALCVLDDGALPALFCVAILRHLQPDILRAAQQQRLAECLWACSTTFAVCDSLDFIQEMDRKYAAAIVADLQAAIQTASQ